MNLYIREAKESDLDWVVNLMQKALEPYYDGNHEDHAKRILKAHLNNGQDSLGFFSFEQRMFIAMSEGKPIGMIHLVGKKQKTYKISPLIVEDENRYKYGVGTSLYLYAEKYIKSKGGIRQIYCTVAENNDNAQRFFKKMGFIKAGSSASHYKSGINENMYYKLLDEGIIAEAIDRENVSVIGLDEARKDMREQIRSMLLKLPTPKRCVYLENSII